LNPLHLQPTVKRAAAILLLLALGTQVFSKLLVMGYYELNKAYIAKTYCVNKQKPQMHCNGRCHMQKQLKKQDEQPDKPSIPNLKDIHETFVFFERGFMGNLIDNANFNIQTAYFFAVNTNGSGCVFHPPC